MMKTKRLYFDLDGVLAVFNKHIPYEQIRETDGYFKDLAPIKCMVDFVNRLIEDGYDVNILSKAENDRIAGEKREWVKRYLPELPEDKIIIVDLYKDKTEYVFVDWNAILFDDYSPNLLDWERCGGVAVNVVTSINHSDRAYVNIEPLPNQYYNSEEFPKEAREYLLGAMETELIKDIEKDFDHRVKLTDINIRNEMNYMYEEK